MGEDFYCFAGVALTLATIGYLGYLVFGPGRPPPVFRSFADIRDGWRQCTTVMDRLLFLALVWRFLKGPAFVVMLVGLTAPIVAIGLSICGMDVEELRIVQAIVQDVLTYLREVRGDPAVVAMTH